MVCFFDDYVDDSSDSDDDLYDYDSPTCRHNNIRYKEPFSFTYISCKKCYEENKKSKLKNKDKWNFNYNDYKVDEDVIKEDNFIDVDFKVLGIKPTKNIKRIKSVFRKLAKRYHPDKGGSDIAFRKIHTAYCNIMSRLSEN
jgi:hypothetical protein|tara:strand:- start:75 stop:497 length:423 start_codon:yes stop_codon:yes gene_type:complete